MPEAVLTRSDLADLGYPRCAVDVIFKHVIREGAGVQMLPGFSRPIDRAPNRSAVAPRERGGGTC